MATADIVTLALLALLALYLFSLYNRLTIRRTRLRNAFAQIEVQLKRRYDLIPNLLETVKGYLQHEHTTLTALAQARNTARDSLQAAAAEPGDREKILRLGQDQGALDQALGHLHVNLEAYPQLQGSQNMAQLSEELTSTENKVAFARQAFNDAVTDYNLCKQQVPALFFARLLGHRSDATLLQFSDSALIQDATRISFQ
ncbi:MULTISPECIES: LemA family protein [Pseudomonas]|uniref:LemA family protein n=1 Tax=Pseudomonas sessilinigenes TaxID=658629 RepID=A0ABX8MV45_9PSED|nr:MULTISPECIES: LemA family protein [Pseudomonas]AZC24093.1 LemA protein [Pseudomonas sessilinigenes]QIH08717.1 LemA family protein [Pseudomonas sp. BIOMIG1BAC]QXH43054.1 LemA family protein [Pseudomonas sessilinigenes]